jgi:predicted RNA-binding Zn ribbon-like protein
VQEFLNTNDIEAARDAFASAPALRAWLFGRDLIPASVVLDDRDRLRAVSAREAIRDLLVARDDGVVDSEATNRLEHLSRAADFALRIRPDRWEFVSADQGIDAVLARILGDIAGAMTDGSWSRLKTCRRDACRWVFWDGSRNRSGMWCAMSICGNRTKGASFRARERGGQRKRRAPEATVGRR